MELNQLRYPFAEQASQINGFVLKEKKTHILLDSVKTRGVTIHQWHGSVRFTVLEPRFGSVRFAVGVGFMSSYQQY